ncbi:hypothetical protein Tco_0900509 [Tanacetum coccineum]
MIYLAMHLAAKAILAKPEGSTAEGYVAEEALTFYLHYLRNVQTRFNRPDKNDDDPPSTCELEVFRSVCNLKSAGVGKKLDDEVKKEASMISTLNAKKLSECSLELFILASGLNDHVTYYTSCIVNDVIYDNSLFDLALTSNLDDLEYTWWSWSINGMILKIPVIQIDMKLWQWSQEGMVGTTVPQTMTAHRCLPPATRVRKKEWPNAKLDRKCQDGGLIGNEIERSVPLCYESWEAVPEKYKGTLWPAINHLACSKKNKANMANQPHSSTQRSKSYATSRHEEWESTCVFPNLIEHSKKSHQKGGKSRKPYAKAESESKGSRAAEQCFVFFRKLLPRSPTISIPSCISEFMDDANDEGDAHEDAADPEDE